MPAAFGRLLPVLLLLAGLLPATPGHADPALLESFEDLRYTDDLDGLQQRRIVRALVIHSKTFYFLDGGRERGMVAEGIEQLERYLNARLNLTRPQQQIHVVAVPVSRDQLIPWLLEGRGDIAAANLTITPAREAQVDFTRPFYDGVSEILVTGKDEPVPRSIDELSRREIFVRPSSSYYEHLEALNLSLAQRGLAPVQLVAADEHLEDEDLLEMVNAGLVPRIVMDDYKARLWAKVFPQVRIHPELATGTQGRIAWPSARTARSSRPPSTASSARTESAARHTTMPTSATSSPRAGSRAPPRARSWRSSTAPCPRSASTANATASTICCLPPRRTRSRGWTRAR